MRAVIQRVKRASVTVEGEIVGQIGIGFLVLLGIEDEDTLEITKKFAEKIAKLRIFEDEQEKMNLSLAQVKGKVLSISQFTLYADTTKGNRPSFTKAGKPEYAKELYLKFNQELKAQGIEVEEGIFAADMKVELLNDGPVTIIMDSQDW